MTDRAVSGYRIPVSRPRIWGDELDEVREAIELGTLSGTSSPVAGFEEDFARCHGVTHAVAVSSGTAALHVALDVLGVGPGDEVVVPDFTMIAPVLAVLYRGAVPVPVDADRTWNMDPRLVVGKLTDRTRAIIVVHTYGHPARVDVIAAAARERGVAVVEDAAEALGARLDGRLVGTFGDIACFSFYANKAITTGEGGMLLTAAADLAAKARAKRNLCFGPTPARRFEHSDVGYNYRLSGLQAAFGSAQLRHLGAALREKQRVAAEYDERLRDVPGLTLPPRTPGIDNVFWVYGIVLDAPATRAALTDRLGSAGIETRPFFTPVHAQPILTGRFEAGSYPVSDRLAANGLYLPSFVGLPTAVIDDVCGLVRDQLGGERR